MDAKTHAHEYVGTADAFYAKHPVAEFDDLLNNNSNSSSSDVKADWHPPLIGMTSTNSIGFMDPHAYVFPKGWHVESVDAFVEPAQCTVESDASCTRAAVMFVMIVEDKDAVVDREDPIAAMDMDGGGSVVDTGTNCEIVVISFHKFGYTTVAVCDTSAHDSHIGVFYEPSILRHTLDVVTSNTALDCQVARLNFIEPFCSTDRAEIISRATLARIVQHWCPTAFEEMITARSSNVCTLTMLNTIADNGTVDTCVHILDAFSDHLIRGASPSSSVPQRAQLGMCRLTVPVDGVITDFYMHVECIGHLLLQCKVEYEHFVCSMHTIRGGRLPTIVDDDDGSDLAEMQALFAN